jgi:hypothetical protein
MKSIITETTEFTYPLLMQSHLGSIAIFTKENEGVYIHHYNDEKLNGIPVFVNILQNSWKPFTGQITLSNQ